MTELKKEITLENATMNELFEELMKRIKSNDEASCYFVDRVETYPKWNIHSSSNNGYTIFAQALLK